MRSFVRTAMVTMLAIGVVAATARAQSGTRSWGPEIGYGNGAVGAQPFGGFGAAPPMPATNAFAGGQIAGVGNGMAAAGGSAGYGYPTTTAAPMPGMNYAAPMGYAAPAMNGMQMGAPMGGGFSGGMTGGSIYGAPSATGMMGAPQVGATQIAAPSHVAAPAATAPADAAPVTGEVVTAPTIAAPAITSPAMPAMNGSVVGAPMMGTQMGGPYMQAMQTGSWQPVYGQVGPAVQSGHWEPVYGPVAAGARARTGPRWFGGVYGLIMDRDDENVLHFITAPATLDALSLCSTDAQMETSGGYEIRFGRTFGRGNWGMEAIFWELLPDDQSATFTADGIQPAYSTIDYRDTYVDFGDDYPYSPTDVRPVPASIFTDSGNIHSARLDRAFDFQNIELNLISRPIYAGGGVRAGRARPFGRGFANRIGGGSCFGGGCGGGPSAACGTNCDPCADACAPCGPASTCGRLHIGWLFGVRYFKFDESLGLTYFRSDPLVPSVGLSTLQHTVEAENDLVGVQLGLNADYYLTQRLQFETGTRFGFYGNNISVNQRVYTDFGNAYVPNQTSLDEFDIRTSDQVVSFLGELRAGLAYKIGCHWRITGGYRGLAASRVALATNQFPFGRSYNGLAKAHDVQSNGDLILHGAYAGLEFAW